MVAIYYRVYSELQTTVRYIVMFCFKTEGRKEGNREERREGKKGRKERREGGRNEAKKIFSLKVYFPM